MKRRLHIFLFWVALLSTQFICAQSSSYVVQADKYMQAFDYNHAEELYKLAATRDTNDIEAWEKLGNLYQITGNDSGALNVYTTAASHYLSNPLSKFYYAQVLRKFGRYDEADSQYVSFSLLKPDDMRSTEFRNFTKQLKPLQEDYQLYKQVPFEYNTAAGEIGPCLAPGKFVFATNQKKCAVRYTDSQLQGFYDLVECKMNDSAIESKPKKLPHAINKYLNEGPASFTKDGKEIYFTRTNYVTVGTDKILRLGIYHAVQDKKGKWKEVTPMPFNSLTYNVAHPSISKDGKKIFFCSDMPGGFGETDIYVSELANGEWQAPVNLGSAINTPGIEAFPHVDHARILYFASDSRVGLGGLDIYSAYYSDSTWGYVTNLGVPVNSRADDFGYHSDNLAKNIYIVSDREGGKGGDDIYHFIKNEASPFNLPSVYFDSSSYELRPDTRALLDTVIMKLQNAPSLVVEVGGNTDARGNDVFNLALSIQRSNACVDYLVAHGISRDRMFIAGYGEDMIANKCIDGVDCNYGEHAHNRRVDFKLIKMF